MGAVAPAFEHHHLFIGHHVEQLAKGWVESLDVAHLQQAASLFRCGDQLTGFLFVGCNGLFNQHVHAGPEAGHAHGVVQQGWHGNANRFHLRDEVVVVSKPAATELFGG